jgi:hypothetical protein
MMLVVMMQNKATSAKTVRNATIATRRPAGQFVGDLSRRQDRRNQSSARDEDVLHNLLLRRICAELHTGQEGRHARAGRRRSIFADGSSQV